MTHSDTLQIPRAALQAQPTPPVGRAAAEPVPPFGSIRKTAMAVYKPPFKYLYGYIYDSENHMVADNGSINDAEPSVSNAIALRIRGWGRIGYMPDAEKLQDEVGAMVADALTAYYTTPQPTPDAEEVERIKAAFRDALDTVSQRNYDLRMSLADAQEAMRLQMDRS